MTINQLSIFIENRSGTLVKVLEVLKRAKIHIIASTIADTADYGIYRVICTEPIRACQELKDAGVAVALSHVFALEFDNTLGRVADTIDLLSRAGVGITYIYTFLTHGKGTLIFRTDNTDRAREVIVENGLKYIAETELAYWV